MPYAATPRAFFQSAYRVGITTQRAFLVTGTSSPEEAVTTAKKAVPHATRLEQVKPAGIPSNGWIVTLYDIVR